MQALYYLVGPPASGKRTIGMQLAAQTGAALIDNHLINDPVFTALGANGRDPLPGLAFDLAGRINAVVREAVRALAFARGAIFAPVWLSCDASELTRRVSRPERLARNKLRDPERLVVELEQMGTLPAPPDALRLDTTDLEPRDAARRIIAFARDVSTRADARE